MSFVANGLLGTLPTLPSQPEVPSFTSNGLLSVITSKTNCIPGVGHDSDDESGIDTQTRELSSFSPVDSLLRTRTTKVYDASLTSSTGEQARYTETMLRMTYRTYASGIRIDTGPITPRIPGSANTAF